MIRKTFFKLTTRMVLISCLLVLSIDVVADTASFQVLSATARDKPISGAEVILLKEGYNVVTNRTDAKGRAKVLTPYETNDKDVILLIKAAGYSPIIVRCPCDGMTYALSEPMTHLDGVRIVLRQADHAKNLRAHLILSGSNIYDHIYYKNPRGDYAHLDVGSREDWHMPETITIDGRQSKLRYLYAVHVSSGESRMNSAQNKSESGTRVQVYVGSSLVRSYFFDPGDINGLLCLFAIDEKGEIFDIKQIQDNVHGEEEIEEVMKEKVKVISLAQHFGITLVDKNTRNADITVLNGSDEKPYKMKK